MAVRIVRLGSPRAKDEGVRIGTVRRPPRGAPIKPGEVQLRGQVYSGQARAKSKFACCMPVPQSNVTSTCQSPPIEYSGLLPL